MKIAGKKIPKGNILVFISFTAISLCLIMIVSLVRADRINDIIKKGLYSGNQRGFYIHNSENENEWDDVIPDFPDNCYNFALYTELPDPEITVRGIYVKGKVVIPPLIYGHYFDEATSWSDTPGVVLGKEYEKSIFEKDGKKFYDYYGTQCEVIGIMGTEADSRINHMIIVDMKTAIRFTGVNTNYIYDAKDSETLSDVGKYINEAFSYPTEVEITLDSGKSYFYLMDFLFSTENIMNTMYVMMLVSFIVSTLLVTYIWLRKREPMFRVWNLCGYKTSSKVVEISKRYYLAAGSGFAAGLVLTKLISAFVSNINIVMTDIIQAFVVNIGVGTVILLGCGLRIRKMLKA